MSDYKPTITEERLAEIEARASAATSGPWLDCGPDIENRGAQSVVLCDAYGARGVLRAEDSAFISAARTDVPDLITNLRAARAEIERLKVEADRRVAEEREACARDCVDVMNEMDDPAEATSAWLAEQRIRARGARV